VEAMKLAIEQLKKEIAFKLVGKKKIKITGDSRLSCHFVA
jgi:hypothetical protein